MMTIRSLNTRKTKFLLAWILANSIGGFLIGFLENNGAQFMATLLLSGGIIGTLQWLTFRWWLGKSGLPWSFWPLASAFGWIISTSLGSLILPMKYAFATLAAETGFWEVFWLNLINQPIWILCMAIAQGTILAYRSRQNFPVLGVWLLASCLGAALHGAVSATLCNTFCQTLPNSLIGIVEGKGWAVYGIVTGVALLWIFKNRDNSSYDF